MLTPSLFLYNILELATTKVYVVKLLGEALRSKEPSVASAETTRIGEANQVASSKYVVATIMKPVRRKSDGLLWFCVSLNRRNLIRIYNILVLSTGMSISWALVSSESFS